MGSGEKIAGVDHIAAMALKTLERWRRLVQL